MSSSYYDRGGKPITMEQWAVGFGDRTLKTVAKDQIGDAKVSTVWLGLDHELGFDGPPLIFETMIFGGEHDKFQERYSTEEQARARHLEIVAALREGREP